MSNTTPFKLIIKDLDKSAQFDSNYPADLGIDSPLCRALYLQMVPTMCDQATIDEFFISLQETRLVGIYLYTVQLSVNGLTDQQVGYIQNF